MIFSYPEYGELLLIPDEKPLSVKVDLAMDPDERTAMEKEISGLLARLDRQKQAVVYELLREMGHRAPEENAVVEENKALKVTIQSAKEALKELREMKFGDELVFDRKYLWGRMPPEAALAILMLLGDLNSALEE